MTKDEAKQLADQALQELHSDLKAGRSETLLRYLDAMSRFHSYSWNNSLLILLQMPTASHVAGYRKWLELGRHVRQGEKGIGIMAPMVYRKKSDSDEQATGDKDHRRILGFRIVHVFDVSQTEGADLPELSSLQADVGHLLPSLEELVRNCGIRLVTETLAPGVKGVSRKGEIAISDSLSGAERLAVLAHEVAHEWMHDETQRADLNRTVRETEAEAVAYVVCRSLGIDCSSRSADYIQLYNGTADTLTASLERIQKTAARMIESLSASSSMPSDESLVA